MPGSAPMSCPPRSGRSTACRAAGDRSVQRLPAGGASRGSAGLSAGEMESGGALPLAASGLDGFCLPPLYGHLPHPLPGRGWLGRQIRRRDLRRLAPTCRRRCRWTLPGLKDLGGLLPGRDLFLPGREGGRRIGRRLRFGALSLVRFTGTSDILFPLFPYGLPFHALVLAAGKGRGSLAAQAETRPSSRESGEKAGPSSFSRRTIRSVFSDGRRGVMYRRPGLLRRICRGLVRPQIMVRVVNTPLPEGLTGPAQLPASGGSRGGEGVHSVCLHLFLRRHGGVGLLVPALL